jgi:hypothetical protein
MALPSDSHTVGDPGHVADHNSIVLRLEALTNALIGTNNLSDVSNPVTALANLGGAPATTALVGTAAAKIWIQATDPGSSAANGDVWIQG